jgi:hypothetical protein
MSKQALGGRDGKLFAVRISAYILLNYTSEERLKAPATWHADGGRLVKNMDEQYGRWWIDIGVVQTVQKCAETCVDDLLGKLTLRYSMTTLPPRRQQLIERTTSALLRILIDELRATKRPE